MGRNLDRLWQPISLELQRRWEQNESAKDLSDNFFFVIENLAGEMVGSISVHDCDKRTGAFSYGVTVKSEHQRKGYASEAVRMVMRYFFEELRYHKVTVHIHSDNPGQPGCMKSWVSNSKVGYGRWFFPGANTWMIWYTA
jgi:RimJ/RimL family protein N-acetyltransferase